MINKWQTQKVLLCAICSSREEEVHDRACHYKKKESTPQWYANNCALAIGHMSTQLHAHSSLEQLFRDSLLKQKKSARQSETVCYLCQAGLWVVHCGAGTWILWCWGRAACLQTEAWPPSVLCELPWQQRASTLTLNFFHTQPSYCCYPPLKKKTHTHSIKWSQKPY